MLYIAADHRGFKTKEELKKYLSEKNIEHTDLGAFELDAHDDYPDYAEKMANSIKEEDRGILLCGSGVGMGIAVNRHKNIWAGLALNKEQVRAARHDDDINVLVIADDYKSTPEVIEMVDVFLNTKFSDEERYLRRIKKIS